MQRECYSYATWVFCTYLLDLKLSFLIGLARPVHSTRSLSLLLPLRFVKLQRHSCQMRGMIVLALFVYAQNGERVSVITTEVFVC